jgi:hypothetical protein
MSETTQVYMLEEHHRDWTTNTRSAEIGDLLVIARIEPDCDVTPPWERDCGHGPVSDWVRRAKLAGELELCRDRWNARYYDIAAATLIARRDGWDAPGAPDRETPRQKAARAARHDFDVLRQWCADLWCYVGVVLSVQHVPSGVMLDNHAASLWGIEWNYPGSDNSYAWSCADEMVSEALQVGKAVLEKVRTRSDA